MKWKIVQNYKSLSLKDKLLYFALLVLALTTLFVKGFYHTGIIKLPKAKAVNCTNVVEKKDIEIKIDKGAFIPNTIDANICDKLIFINLEDTLHEPATGPHPSHTSYPGFDAKRPLQKNDRYEFVLNRSGDYTFHDHLNDNIRGSIKIQK